MTDPQPHLAETETPEQSPTVAAPRVSIVLTSVGTRAQLDAAIAQFRRRYARRNSEIVVVRVCSSRQVAVLREAHPGVRFVAMATDTPHDELRRAGMRAATGDVVMMFDDRVEDGARVAHGPDEKLLPERRRPSGRDGGLRARS